MLYDQEKKFQKCLCYVQDWIYTSSGYVMLSSRCMSVYTEKIQVTPGIFHSIQQESISMTILSFTYKINQFYLQPIRTNMNRLSENMRNE
jgi:hypothetical protein